MSFVKKQRSNSFAGACSDRLSGASRQGATGGRRGNRRIRHRPERPGDRRRSGQSHQLGQGPGAHAATDVTGRYALPNLPIGNYQLEVSSPGFKTYVQKGIELEVASNRSIPVACKSAR